MPKLSQTSVSISEELWTFWANFSQNDGNHVKRHHIKLWIRFEQYTATDFQSWSKKALKVKTAHFPTFVGILKNAFISDI